MRLIGMLDSPFVRRVAISLQLLELPFEHEALSVFRTFEQFQRINPVVKAPSLICDDGQVLMDSNLILTYAEALAHPSKRLIPAEPLAMQHCLHVTGLALAACEKSVQIVYEHTQRPSEKAHEPWLQRVTGQLFAAYDGLELCAQRRPLGDTSETIDQAGITLAVAWAFTQLALPDLVSADRYPGLQAFSKKAEALPAFLAAPYGDGTYPVV